MVWFAIVWAVGVPATWVMLRFVLAAVSMGNDPAKKEKGIALVLAVFWPVVLIFFLSYCAWGWMRGDL